MHDMYTMLSKRMNLILFLGVIFWCAVFVHSSTADDYLNKCISSTNHKNVPGKEGKAMENYHCTPWQNKSCCTWNTTDNIDKDGALSLYNIVWDQCPKIQNMSDKCKQHFKRDTCFYECSPNLGPWIVADTTSKKTRKERVRNVPICKSDCEAWFSDCSEDYTCNDNWATGWDWSKKGTPAMCPKSCKKFKDYFSSAKQFCEKLFDGSFVYSENNENCMNMVPVGDNNVKVSEKKAEDLASTAARIQQSIFGVLLSSLIYNLLF
ncbi:folate receptor gamma-like [Clytia hemisphaerica]|uniref:Folate receptor-like domain-containing protein n=1 Tax=Clytia hemisphaerica TaxID=252671 RepID=A0A7M5VEK5_9CNID